MERVADTEPIAATLVFAVARVGHGTDDVAHAGHGAPARDTGLCRF